jgi:hypothetical protein
MTHPRGPASEQCQQNISLKGDGCNKRIVSLCLLISKFEGFKNRDESNRAIRQSDVKALSYGFEEGGGQPFDTETGSKRGPLLPPVSPRRASSSRQENTTRAPSDAPTRVTGRSPWFRLSRASASRTPALSALWERWAGTKSAEYTEGLCFLCVQRTKRSSLSVRRV